MIKTINELETDLKLIDENFTVIPNDNNELAGIYWKGYYTDIAFAKDGIKDARDEGYCDYFMRPHKTIDEVMTRVHQFIEAKERPEYMEQLTAID